MTLLKIPSFDNIKSAKKSVSRNEIRAMYAGLESKKLESIKNHSLMYAINRTKRYLKEISDLLSPEKVITGWEDYNAEIRKLHEDLSGGKTIENPVSGTL